MSKRKNGTNRAAAALGLNPYGWGNGWKKPRKLSNKKGPAAATARTQKKI